MPFQKGQSGNPGGQAKDKPWRLAIHQALQMPSFDGKRRKLDDIADTLVRLAVAGDTSAIKEIGDRMDGKPAQAIVGDADQPVTLTITWAKEEVLALHAPKDALSPSDFNEEARRLMASTRGDQE